jgi:hypothetical protein
MKLVNESANVLHCTICISNYFNYLPTFNRMLHYFLFTVYAVFFCWAVIQIPFIKKTGLSPKIIVGLFILKVAAGVLLGWTSLHLYGINNDYWDTNKYGWEDYQLLFSDPGKYFDDLFNSGYATGYGNMFDATQSHWNDLRSKLIVKLASVVAAFSRGNYYTSSIFFSFIGFLGHVALYRIFISIYQNKKWLVLAGSFLLPSLLFYSSGINRDSVIFFAIGMLCWFCYSGFQQKFSTKKILGIITCMLIIFFIRNFILLAMLPAILAWFICEKKKWSPFRTFAVVYAVYFVIFFNFDLLFPSANLPATIAKRQSEFLQLPQGSSDIYLSPLYPTFRSYLNNTPQALNHILMRPYITEVNTVYGLPFALELLLYQLLFVLFLLFRKQNATAYTGAFIMFGFFFTFSVYLNIGYTIPNVGSLIRYRSLYLSFLIIPILAGIIFIIFPQFH